MNPLEFEYAGHSVRVDASEARGGWVWEYLIDGSALHTLLDRSLPTESLALDEGKRSACGKIDLLNEAARGERDTG